jgi:hypothetical protein
MTVVFATFGGTVCDSCDEVTAEPMSYTDWDEGEAFEFCVLCFAEQKAYDAALEEGGSQDEAFAAMDAWKASHPRV